MSSQNLFNSFGNNLLNITSGASLYRATKEYLPGQVISHLSKEYRCQNNIFPGQNVLLTNGIAIGQEIERETNETILLDRQTVPLPNPVTRADTQVCILFSLEYLNPNRRSPSVVEFFDYNTRDIDTEKVLAAGKHWPGSENFYTHPQGLYLGARSFRLESRPSDASFDRYPNPACVSPRLDSYYPSTGLVAENRSYNFFGEDNVLANSFYNPPPEAIGWIPSPCTPESCTCGSLREYGPRNITLPYNDAVSPPQPPRDRYVNYTETFWYTGGITEGPPIINPDSSADGWTRVWPGIVYTKDINDLTQAWAYNSSSSVSCDSPSSISPDPILNLYSGGNIIFTGTLTGNIIPGSTSGNYSSSVTVFDGNSPYVAPNESLLPIHPSWDQPFVEYYAFWKGKVHKFPKAFIASWSGEGPLDEGQFLLFNNSEKAYVVFHVGGSFGDIDRNQDPETYFDLDQPWIIGIFEISENGVTLVYERNRVVEGNLLPGSIADVSTSLIDAAIYPEVVLGPFDFLSSLFMTDDYENEVNWVDKYPNTPKSVAFTLYQRVRGAWQRNCLGYSTEGDHLIFTDESSLPFFHWRTDDVPTEGFFFHGVELKYGFYPISNLDNTNYTDNLALDTDMTKRVSIPALIDLIPDTNLETLNNLPENQFEKIEVLAISINDGP
jgi:hypothetical protein